MSEHDSKETPCQWAMVKDGFLWFPSWQANAFYGFRRWLFMVSVVAGNICLWFQSLAFLMVSGCYRTVAASPMETVSFLTPGRFRDELSIYIYIYIYIHTYIHVYIYIYIYIHTHIVNIISTAAIVATKTPLRKMPTHMDSTAT